METGTVVQGEYVLGPPLGDGTSMVFKAKSQRDARDVAVRLLPTPPGAIADLILDQAGRARGVRHEALASVLDAGRSEDGTIFVVSELANGIPLDQWAHENGIPPLRKVVEFVHRLCAALQIAEREGLYHETLAPHNVLINGLGRGSEGWLQGQLLDLGVPAIAHSQPLRLQAARFMAPEQLIQLQRGNSVGGTANATSNVYALGGILYLLCTGEAPYEARNLGELLSAHAERSLARPSRINPVLPSSLTGVIMQALSPDPAARHPSLGSFSNALLQTLQPIGKAPHGRPSDLQAAESGSTPPVEPVAPPVSESETYPVSDPSGVERESQPPGPSHPTAAWPQPAVVGRRRQRIPTGSFGGEPEQTGNQGEGPFVVPRGSTSASPGSASRRTRPTHSQTVPVEPRTPTDPPSSPAAPAANPGERRASPSKAPLPPVVPPYEGAARARRDSQQVQHVRTSTVRGRRVTGAPLPPVQGPASPEHPGETTDVRAGESAPRSSSGDARAERYSTQNSTGPRPSSTEHRHAPDLTTSRIRLEVTLADEDEEPILDHGRQGRSSRLSPHGTYAPYIRVGSDRSTWQRIRPILAVVVGLLSLLLAVLVYRRSSAPPQASMYVSTPNTGEPAAATARTTEPADSPTANAASPAQAETPEPVIARTEPAIPPRKPPVANSDARGPRMQAARDRDIEKRLGASTTIRPEKAAARKPARATKGAASERASAITTPAAEASPSPEASEASREAQSGPGQTSAAKIADSAATAAPATAPTTERALTLNELLDMPLPTRRKPASDTENGAQAGAQEGTTRPAIAIIADGSSAAPQREGRKDAASSAEPAPSTAPTNEPTTPANDLPLTAQVRLGELEVRGSLATSVIRRSVERVRSEFKRCYDDAAAKAGRNAFGPVQISFEIDFRGRSRAPAVEGAKLPGMAGCLRNALQRIATNRAPDTGTVRTTLQLDFSP